MSVLFLFITQLGTSFQPIISYAAVTKELGIPGATAASSFVPLETKYAPTAAMLVASCSHAKPRPRATFPVYLFKKDVPCSSLNIPISQ